MCGLINKHDMIKKEKEKRKEPSWPYYIVTCVCVTHSLPGRSDTPVPSLSWE